MVTVTKRRWLFRITLCLVLGVVTTVGVAWGFALFADVGLPASPICESKPEVVSGEITFGVGGYVGSGFELVYALSEYARSSSRADEWIEQKRLEDIVPSYANFELPSGSIVDGTATVDMHYCIAFGWPMRALFFEYRSMWTGDGITRRKSLDKLTRGIALPDAEPIQDAIGSVFFRTLPLGLAHGGFITNTLFYATIWYGLVYTFGPVKRWNRKRRGLCPMCKYNLRGNPEGVPGCAECGWGREAFTAESPRARSEEGFSVEEQQA